MIRRRQRLQGFSLIELMVVVTVIGILAALAYPTYSHYAYRGRRTEGQALLMRIAMAEEHYYALHNTFGALADMGFTAPLFSQHRYYEVQQVKLEDTGEDGQAYTLTAHASNAQADDACGDLMLDSSGKKWSARSDAAAQSNGPCW